LISLLRNKYGLKLKDVGNMSFYLDWVFSVVLTTQTHYVLDQNPTLTKMIGNYKKLFSDKPKEYSLILEKNDHSELDTSDILDDDGTKQYQSMIGEFQWAISLARFDIIKTVMSMSQY
jgi:hypothetical protein